MTTVSMLTVVSKKSFEMSRTDSRANRDHPSNPALARRKNTTEAAARKSNIESRHKQPRIKPLAIARIEKTGNPRKRASAAVRRQSCHHKAARC
jgi:hypothetical protein